MLMKLAATSTWILGLGFGVPCVYAIWYFARHNQVWTLMGYPTYGQGPFTRIGIETTVPLLVAFLAVCATEVIVGWLLWHQPAAGGWIAMALLPLELAFWFGFGLPYAILLGAVRTVLILVAVSPLAHLGT